MEKCPVCKEKLSFEMMPVGTEKGETKKKLKMGAIIPQVITWAIDTSIRASVGSGRSLYLLCNNADCPCCWKPSNPIYFKQGILGPVLVGDSAGLRLSILQGQYKKKKKRGGGR